MRGEGFARAAWLGAALILGCGCGDEPVRPVRTSMVAERDAAPHGNAPPVVDSVRFEPAEPMPGELVRVLVRATDPDGDPVELGYRWSLDGRRVPGDGPTFELRQARKGQRIEVAVTASDGRAESPSASLAVRLGNQAPEMLQLRLEPAGEVPRGASVTVSPRARDADGDSLEFAYRWKVNQRWVEEDGPSLSTEGLQRGDRIRVRVVASDGERESPELESEEVRIANAPPQFVSSPPSGWEDGVFRYALEARDPDGDRQLRFRLLEGPEGMKLDPVLGTLTWQPMAEQTGRHPVDVLVEDAYGGRSAQRFELTVSEVPEPAPEAPPAAPAEE